MTPDQVRAFQEGPLGGPKPIGFDGKILLVDGNLGAKTQWALDIATLPVWRQNVVRFLLQLNGMLEEGVNRGRIVDRAIAICRLDNDVDGPGPSEDGFPWCAAIASLALSQHSPYPFVPDASVTRLARSLYDVAGELALPADVAYTLNPDGTGHLGTVIARGGGWTASVDGNLGNRMRVVRYPTHERLYASVEPRVRCPKVPMAITQYTGSTR